VINNTILLTAKSHTLDGNDVDIGSNILLYDSPYLEGGTRLNSIKLTAKTAGAAGNLLSLSPGTGTPIVVTAAMQSGSDEVPSNSTDLKPEYILDWPLIGIHAEGQLLNISNVHIEGVTIGINVVQSAGRSNVGISGVDVNHLMDADMVYYNDPAYVDASVSLSKQAIAYQSGDANYRLGYWKYCCAVLISYDPSGWRGYTNQKDRVTILNVSSHGFCKYLLRDGMYNIEQSAFGLGQFPNTCASAMTFYARTDPWAPSLGIAPYAYATDHSDAPLLLRRRCPR